MKRIIAIILLSAYLFSTTEFHELLKLPALANHYQEHKSEKPSISFWQFLCIHYAHGDVMDKDHDKDMKLPFKSHDCTSINLIALLNEEKNDINRRLPGVPEKSIPNYYNEIIITHSLKSIWQPPKIG